jgi:adenosylcobinamide-GDP ribazoletransferase
MESGEKMNVIKSIAIAFSMYSRIPMPTFKWEDQDYKHAISFLPLVGAVIGILVTVAAFFKELPVFVLTVILALIPLVITGGFHLDGFMDVTDARSSFAEKEKSLEIMEDPHIGAFAVIGLVKLALAWGGALYMVVDSFSTGRGRIGVYCYGISFMAVRALCGLWSILLTKAKDSGMLSREAGGAETCDIMLLMAQLVFAMATWAFADLVSCLVCLGALGLFSVYYWRMCKKRFGGVTGDTAGYFVTMGELVVLVALAALGLVVRF